MAIRIAILTVSDTAAVEREKDRSGPAIKQIVSEYDCAVKDEDCWVVADDVSQIRGVILEWVERGTIDWIITTGGTGFGQRDVTPEAVAPMIERPATGLVHLMLSSSLVHTRFAALARPVAGTIKKTLVTTLPGSVRAVNENLSALFEGGLVTHAIDLIKGGSGQQVHAALATSGSETSLLTPGHLSSGSQSHSHGSKHHRHHHHRHHDRHGSHEPPKPRSAAALSHDPTAPASARYRTSPYPQISLESALNILSQTVQRLPIETRPVDHKLSGYVLAEDVYAPMNVPTRATTSVDGYALRSTDLPGVYRVLTAQTHFLNTSLPAGYVYRVNTGGPLPVGADTIIMVEDTRLVSTHEEATGPNILIGEEKEIETLAQIPSGENVRPPGSDVKKGELVLKKGDRIMRTGGDVATLAFVGRREVKVYRKPVVALLSTGNELVDLHAGAQTDVGNEGWGGIFDTNRPALYEALVDAGYDVHDLGIIPDEVEAHVQALKEGFRKGDLVLTTGGTSMGPTDLLKPVIERYLGGTVHFGRVSVKPGKPTTFATVPFDEGSHTISKPIFALPGNPASALVTFYVFVLPALRKMGGWLGHQCALPKVIVELQNPMQLDPRVEFHRVIVRSMANSTGYVPGADKDTPCLKAYSTGGQRSSRAGSLCGANGLVVLPALQDMVPKTKLEAGDHVQALLIGELEMQA